MRYIDKKEQEMFKKIKPYIDYSIGGDYPFKPGTPKEIYELSDKLKEYHKAVMKEIA